MTKRFLVATFLLALVAFAIPIEHKYDKLFRFFSLTLIPDGLDLSKNYDKKIYFYISDLIAIGLLFMALFWFRVPVRRFFFHPIWIVFLCALGSIVASPFVHYPVAYIRLFQLLTPLIFFSFVAHAFSDEERSKMTRILFFTIVIAALFQSVIGVAQYFHEAPLGLRLLGESNNPSFIPVKNGTRWIFDRLFNTPLSGSNTKMRAAGTLPHANVLGGLLTLSILMTFALIVQARKARWFLILTLPLQLFALYLTYSRSALFALCIGTFVWFGLVGFKDRTVRLLGITIAALIPLSGLPLIQQIVDRGGILNYNALVRGSDSVRWVHQKLSLEIVKNNPFLGLGYSQYSERSQTYLPSETDAYTRSTGPHNIFLFLACETGLISLGAFLFTLFLLFWNSFRTPLTIEKATLVASFFAFLFIGCCDFYPILFQQGKLLFFLILGLLAAHTQLKPKSILV